jgi:polyisoprenyl-phosphate glycosyltransferase
MNRQAPYISCVIPAYNEQENIALFIMALDKQLNDISAHHEIIVVDDGSRDKTCETLIQQVDARLFKLIRFSRNFGKEAALTAGLDHAQGDVVILMDADFQHPLSTIPDFLEKWHEGYEMVYGVRRGREMEPRWKKLGARLFYKILSAGSRQPIPTDAGDFRLIDRKVVDALKQLPERSRFMKGLYAWVGFKTIGVPFDVQDRFAGTSQFKVRHLSALAITAITAFSDLPLRVWSIIGAFISGCSLIYAAYIIYQTVIQGNDVAGWSTLAVGLLFFGGVQLLSIGILGEYIARIFNEVKQRPNYIMSEKIGFNNDTKPD